VRLPRILCIFDIHSNMKVKMLILVSPLIPDWMYKRVTAQIKNGIAGGDSKPEDRLPSTREMAASLKIIEIPVKLANGRLQKENCVLTGSGLDSLMTDGDTIALIERKGEE
jgi:DNA-binding transcriptional regulator YhcF (GntR family)